MIELVLVFCLVSEADRCMERREPIGDNAAALACTVRAQQIAEEYIETHPQWRLLRWRCEKDVPPRSPA